MNSTKSNSKSQQESVSKISQITKEELLNHIFIFRQIFGLIFGICAGLYHLQGFPVFVIFIISNMVMVYLYTYKYVNVNEQLVEENEVYFEAMMISLFIFVLTWTVTHTFANQ